ncbi:LOW QUALITY PROTEIN: hypothetical protein HZS_1913 [Henneguya salminicola]|nr:LOW QUALITY PROTEIN: hypothetical protein HZS_1913 [Henneguya salminicola]
MNYILETIPGASYTYNTRHLNLLVAFETEAGVRGPRCSYYRFQKYIYRFNAGTIAASVQSRIIVLD